MKQLYLFFLLTILSPLFVNAQANFKPGYIINTSGDTTKGFIDYKDWNFNPAEVNFKKELSNQQVQAYTANDIAGFMVNGYECYKSYRGTITMDKVNELNILSSTLDTSTISGTFFIKVLATGKNINLYSYTDHIKERLFIAENGKLPVELIYHMFLRPTEKETTYVVTIDSYRQQLEELVIKYQPQNAALLQQIKNVNYTEESIEKILFKLNGSETTTALFSAANHNSGLQVFLGGGINTANASPGYSAITFPELNLGINVFFNKNVKKLIFRFEANYTTRKGQIQNYFYTVENTPIPLQQYHTVFINPQLLYNFYNKPGFKVYGTFGGACTIDFDMPAATVKAGLVLANNFDVYAGYNQRFNMFGYSSYDAGINYIFGKK